MRAETIIREWLNRRNHVPELGDRHVVCDWVRPEDGPGPWVDEQRFGELLTLLPDKIVTNLVKAKDAQDGRIPLLKAGLGYEECLSSIIVDGVAIASSSTEAFLVPANLLPANYLQPGGIPGRTLVIRARGRQTTLTTAATLTYKLGAALTNVIPTTTWAVSGAITMDVTVQTATMWRVDCSAVVRSVGSAGTVFAMGDVTTSAAALTLANQTASFMGSAGSATPATAAVDMTVPQYLGFTGKWSLTTAYSIQCHRYVLEALN
jgi:hypothetical protein